MSQILENLQKKKKNNFFSHFFSKNLYFGIFNCFDVDFIFSSHFCIMKQSVEMQSVKCERFYLGGKRHFSICRYLSISLFLDLSCSRSCSCSISLLLSILLYLSLALSLDLALYLSPSCSFSRSISHFAFIFPCIQTIAFHSEFNMNDFI